MAKSRDAFRTISEVADWLETPAHVLRFWESKFPQIKPVKRAGGRRYYRPEDMALLGGIKTLLHDQGMTIKGAQRVIRDLGVRHVAALGPQPESDDGDAIAVEGSLAHSPASPSPASPSPASPSPASPPPASPSPASPSPAPYSTAPAPSTTPPTTPSPLPSAPAGAILRKPARTLPEAAPARATAAQDDLLALVLATDPRRLRGKSAAIAPLVLRLERLRDKMRQEQG